MNRVEVNQAAENLLENYRTLFDNANLRKILTAAVRKLGKLKTLRGTETTEPEEAAE